MKTVRSALSPAQGQVIAGQASHDTNYGRDDQQAISDRVPLGDKFDRIEGMEARDGSANEVYAFGSPHGPVIGGNVVRR